MFRMIRSVSVALLAALMTMNAVGAAVAGRVTTPTISVVAPSQMELGVSTAISLHLPANVAAVEGRLFVNQSAVEVIGVAPRDGGTALRPVEVANGGHVFAAYGLRAVNGHTTLDLVVYPKEAGRLQVRVVVDAAADKDGRRLVLGRFNQMATLGVGRAVNVVAAPDAAPGHVAARTAGPTRDLVLNGRIDRQDLDIVRGDWYMARQSARPCGAAIGGDANADGCIDIVDLQAQLAAQGQRSAAPAPAGVTAVGQTFTVTSTADTPDAANGNGVCADSSGQCTLRAAMTEADWLPGDDRIEFALTGTAPVTIQLASRLPNISATNGSLTIDGYSQPGSQVNTATVGSNAIMGVEIRGNGQAAREMAFYVTSAGNTIRGLLINNIWRGIMMDSAGAHHNWVIGNWIGFNKDGSSPGSGSIGVLFNYGAHHNHNGAPALADRNVIGNFTLAEDNYGPGTDFNVTQNNVMCIRPNGFATATCSSAIDHNFGPKNHLIGGSGPNERNVIGPTWLQGIELSHGFNPSTYAYNTTYQVSDNQLIGNWVGFRGNGSYDPAYRSGLNFSGADNGQGINVYDGSNNNLVEGNYVASVYDGIQVGLYSPYAVGNTVRNNIIGVSPLGENAPLTGWGIISRGNGHHNIFEGNTIRNAARGGLGLTNTNNNGGAGNVAYNTRISQNIITNTNGPAIDLYGPAGGGGAGPDPNDPGDVDNGANTQVNTPLFTSVTTAGASGTAYAGSTVELFRASRPIGQFGLPTAYLGSATVAGNGTWTIPVALALGDIVTALQIRPDLNTSELAANVAATLNQAPVFSTDFGNRTDAEGAVISLDANATDPDGNPLTYSATNLPSGITINASTGVISGTLSAISSGTYNVVITVSDGSLTDTDSFTWTVTQSNVLADDLFSRTVVNSWGSATSGGAYTLQGNRADYDVTGSAGTMSLNGAGVLRSAVLTGVSATDVDVSFRVATNKTAAGGNQFIYGVVRRINATTEYRAKLRLAVNGNVYIQASSVSGNVETAIGSEVQVAGLTYTPGSFIWLRTQVSGSNPTTIRVRAWADGSAEPGTWQYSATNSVAALQTAGAVGLRGYLSGGATNAPVIFTFDNFRATSIGGP